jgi:hypothetical protein
MVAVVVSNLHPCGSWAKKGFRYDLVDAHDMHNPIFVRQIRGHVRVFFVA